MLALVLVVLGLGTVLELGRWLKPPCVRVKAPLRYIIRHCVKNNEEQRRGKTRECAGPPESLASGVSVSERRKAGGRALALAHHGDG